MDDREFDLLLDAVERGEDLPEGMSADDAADLAAAGRLLAARRALPEPMAGRSWQDEPVASRSAPVQAGNGGPGRAGRRLFGRRWLPELAILALIAMLGAVVWFGSRQLAPAQGGQTPVAPEPTSEAGPAGPAAGGELEGWLVYAERPEAEAQTTVKAIDLKTGEDRAFLTAFTSPSPDFSPTQLSPDGRWVALDAPVGMVMMVDTVGRSSPSAVAYGPDGQASV
jgi:hypothetical protein